MKPLILAVSTLLLLLASPIACDRGAVPEPGSVIGGNGGPEKERRAALVLAARFVEALDRGERVAPMLAAFLRADATDDSLDAAFIGFRSWTGPFERRTAFAYGYSESVPDLPPGKYFTVLYRSHFEHGNVEEKVIVSVDEQGTTVAGYFQGKRILYSTGAPSPGPSESMPPLTTMTR